MADLSPEQLLALDTAPTGGFARFADPASTTVFVLLPADDFDWIRGVLGDEPDVARSTDPRSGRSFALVPERRFERFKAFFEEDPVAPGEREWAFREAGRRAGWNDPAWDSHDDVSDREAS